MILWLTPLAVGGTVPPDDLGRALQALQDGAGGPVVVAPAGPEAKDLVDATLAKQPTLQVEVHRIHPAAGADEELQRLLDKTGLDCAVRVGFYASMAEAELLTLGACGDGELPPPPAAAVRTGEAPEAPIDDAVPPVTRVQTKDPPLASVDLAAALRTYGNRFLRRDKLEFDTTSVWMSGNYAAATTHHTSTWAVYEGGSRLMPVIEFTDRVGQPERAAELGADRKGLRTSALVWGFSSLGLAVAGPVLAIDGALRESSAETAVGVGALGASLIALIPSAIQAGRYRRFDHTPRHYSASEVDALIETHNEALREELGVTGEQTLEMDLPR